AVTGTEGAGLRSAVDFTGIAVTRAPLFQPQSRRPAPHLRQPSIELAEQRQVGSTVTVIEQPRIAPAPVRIDRVLMIAEAFVAAVLLQPQRIGAQQPRHAIAGAFRRGQPQFGAGGAAGAIPAL